MQKMFDEKNLQRAVIIDNQGQTYLSVGYQNNRWQLTFPNNVIFFDSISHNHNIYGAKLDASNPDSVWLMIELDNQPLELARYKILLSLVATGLITLDDFTILPECFSRRGWHHSMKSVCRCSA